MAKINPDFLIRDELEFEVKSRGDTPASSVADLRKQLRNLLKGNRPSEPVKLTNEKVEFDLCKDRAADLISSVEDLGENPDLSSRVVFRLRLRLEHLERRLSNLGQVATAKEELKWSQSLLSVQECLRRITPGSDADFPVADGIVVAPAPLVQSKGTASDSDSKDFEAPSQALKTNPEDLNLEPGNLNNQPEARNLSATSSSRSQAPHVPEILVLGGAHPKDDSGISLKLDSAGYGKLPNPLGSLLQRLPITDGLDAEKLLNFLGSLINIREFPGMTGNTLLRIIFPYCRSPLTERLLSCMERNVVFELFHQEILDYFIPSRLREQLKQRRFFRLQRSSETLASFVTDIKLVAKVLRVGMSELEIVGVILDGVAPEERSRLVFSSRPTNFAELDRLCVTSRSVAYADSLRQGQGLGVEGRRIPVRQILPEVQKGCWNAGNQLVCFGCGERGHIRRFCNKSDGRTPQTRNGGTRTNFPKNGNTGAERNL